MGHSWKPLLVYFMQRKVTQRRAIAALGEHSPLAGRGFSMQPGVGRRSGAPQMGMRMGMWQRPHLGQVTSRDGGGGRGVRRAADGGRGEMELGLRLRYEIRREFAPYTGLSWSRRFGGSAVSPARMARSRESGAAGEFSPPLLRASCWLFPAARNLQTALSAARRPRAGVASTINHRGEPWHTRQPSP